MAVESPSRFDGLFVDDLYEAAELTLEIVRRIKGLEKNMVSIGGRESADYTNLLRLKSDAVNFSKKVRRLADYQTKRKNREIQGKMAGRRETGGESPGRRGGRKSLDSKDHAAAIETQDSGESPGRSGRKSLDSEELLHHVAAIETQDRIVCMFRDEFPEEIHRLFSGILLKFEHKAGNTDSVFEDNKSQKEASQKEAEAEAAGNTDSVFADKKSQKEASQKEAEAEAVLRFGLKVDSNGQEIDELRRDLRGLVKSFSPENKEVRSTLISFTGEPYLHRNAKLQWISKRIKMLQRLDPELDNEVRSKMIELKSDYLLSALEEEESSGGKGVAAEDAVEMDEKRFAFYRLCWERTWGMYSFENQTLLSSMQFTHCRGRIPADAVAGSTLQIYSIKVSGKKLDWPLDVYGVVSARDAADRHSNPLFCRRRSHCQILTQEDPFLQLTGPVRAIVTMDTVYIETQLKIKDASVFDDTVLVRTFMSYDGKSFRTSAHDNRPCTIELCFEQLEQSVQATVLSVVLKTTKSGSLPSPYGGKIVCSSLPSSGNDDFAGLPSRQVVLFDSGVEVRDGHLDLLRRVVCVELKGKLKFHVQTYSQSLSAEIGAAHVLFTPQKTDISKGACDLADGSKVEITVAWSLLPSSKMLS